MRIVWMAALVAGCGERFPETEGAMQTFPGPYGSVDVSAESGRIELVAGGGDAVELEFLASGSDTWSFTEAEGNLQIVANCLGEEVVGCAGGFVLTIPANQEASAKTATGQLAFTGLLGGILTGQTASGEIRANGLGPADLELLTGTGAVDLTILEVPTRVSIDTGSSAVAMELPAGGYALDIEASNGTATVDPAITDDPSGPELRVHSGAGNIGIVPLEG